ncbi:hypothetical protein Mterra_00206 [Calidithermus terrae]|uniref:Uncharacterized protein n=1 Tax=Calidithermus terrae TaxID=1408545 RepID=A0A399F743_9DEIN|nr:hypothetical protein [Calidithermus terrae]RIH90712.1 hypothetical protein Mterra_00206 [Calidithermus terrae]
MEPSEFAEFYDDLRRMLAGFGLGWIADQVEAALALETDNPEQSPEDRAARRLEALLDGVERVFAEAYSVSAAAFEGLSSLAGSEIVSVAFVEGSGEGPDAEREVYRVDHRMVDGQGGPLAELREALEELRAEIWRGRG